jgi:hypothetical protein
MEAEMQRGESALSRQVLAKGLAGAPIDFVVPIGSQGGGDRSGDLREYEKEGKEFHGSYLQQVTLGARRIVDATLTRTSRGGFPRASIRGINRTRGG